MSNTHGIPEFPAGSRDYLTNSTISLRDLFAGQALNGLISAGYSNKDGGLPKVSYDIAEEMLAERAKREGKT